MPHHPTDRELLPAETIAPCCHDQLAHMRVPPVRPLQHAPEELAREEARRSQGLLSGVTDAHVHLFPDGFYAALHRWFDANAWNIQFRGGAEQVLAKLAEAGTSRVIALVFAHKPGVARVLNRYLADLARAHPNVTGVGSVQPGEPEAVEIVRQALDLGLRGIKLHCHVQKVAIDDPRTLQVLAECQRLGVPAVVHAGREPSSPAYGVDTHAICNVERTRRVLQQLPDLTLVVPHVGADEYAGYLSLLAEFPGLYLDTAMACADYFEHGPGWQAVEKWADRILYGTDFPIVPYEVDRELRVLARKIPSDQALQAITRGTAQQVWGR